MSFLPFLLMVALVLFGAHAVLGVSIAHFFSLTTLSQRLVLALIMTGLSASFIVASILAHLYENLLTRAFYFVSGIWLGLLTYLVFSSIIIWIILWVAPRISAYRIDTPRLAVVFLVLSIMLSIFGMWNAFHPRIKEVSVRIPGLPAAWQDKKIIQLSDVHLGHIYHADFLRGVVIQANEMDPAMVVITGDLFDGMDGSLGDLVSPLRELRSEHGIFFVTGNHETYLGVETVRGLLADAGITVLDDEVVDVDGLALIGIGYPERGETKDMSETLRSLSPGFAGRPNILLFHSPTHIDLFRSSGINLQLAGHTHLGQIFPFNYLTHRIFKGYDYGLFEEADGYSLYTTNGVGTWGPAMRIGNTPEIVVITLRGENQTY